MELSPAQIERLTLHLRDKYLEAGGSPFWKKTEEGDQYSTNPERYENLAYWIDSQEVVKPSWLKTLFVTHLASGKSVNFHDTIINRCCESLTGQDANTYFTIGNAQTHYYGRYQVWWSGSVYNLSSTNYYHGFDVEISAEKVQLINEGEPRYRGISPMLLNNKLHLELNKTSGTERVYFILHVAEARGNNLNYIPGVFAAGDNTNTVPCCGLVLFVRQGNSPNSDLLKAYFEKEQIHNLVRSWSIAEVLEEWRVQRNRSARPHKREFHTEQKLQWFLNQTFYCYYYRRFEPRQGREDAIGRGVLTIGNTPDSVKLVTIGIENQVIYYGSVKLLSPTILSFALMTETNERNLSINYRIASGEMHHLAVGTYSNIGTKGEPISGTTILEHISEPGTELTAGIWRKSDPEYLLLQPNFRRFFFDHHRNFIATPAKGIFSHEGLELFFSEQENKTHRVRPFIPGITRIFIAAPMSSHMVDFEEIRPHLIKVTQFLRQEARLTTYYAGEAYDPEVNFRLQSYLEAAVDLKELQRADHLFLIHPGRIASSCLVEIGYALGQAKTCHIFTKDRKDLPFLLRCLQQPNVFFHEYTDIQEVLEIVKRVVNQSGTDLPKD